MNDGRRDRQDATITLTDEFGARTSSVHIVRNPAVRRGSPPQVCMRFTDHEDDQEPFMMRANAVELRAMGLLLLGVVATLEMLEVEEAR